jgi:hypothetical protein
MLLDLGFSGTAPGAPRKAVSSEPPSLPGLIDYVATLPDTDTGKQKKVKVLSECELRFLITTEDAREVLAHSGSAKKWLEQRYLNPSFIPHLRELLERLGRASIPENLLLTSARLRRVRKNGEVTYYLELKGPKDEVHRTRIERAEISQVLGDRQLIRLLRKAATDGLIRKTRHRIKGKVWSKDGKSKTIYAQLDFITSCGVGDKYSFFRAPPFVTIDVEMPPRWIRDFRAGRHNLGFLKSKAVEISALPTDQLAQFSNKLMAKSSIGTRLTSLAKTLLAKLLRPKKKED